MFSKDSLIVDLEAHREKEKQLAEDQLKMERLLMNKRRKSSTLDEKELEQVRRYLNQ